MLRISAFESILLAVARIFGLCFLLALDVAVLLTEPLHTSARIDDLLHSGKERVALGADFYSNVFPGRTDMIYLATGARNGSLLVIRMYLLFHNITPGYARQTNVLQHANMKKYSTGEGSGQLFCLAVVRLAV
jgi:hypothetical protein